MPIDLQFEVIDMQAYEVLKEKHKEGQFVEFYRSLADNVFPNLKKFASKMASMFGTAYICKQTFSTMKYVKSKHRTRLTDDKCVRFGSVFRNPGFGFTGFCTFKTRDFPGFICCKKMTLFT